MDFIHHICAVVNDMDHLSTIDIAYDMLCRNAVGNSPWVSQNISKLKDLILQITNISRPLHPYFENMSI